MTPASLPACKHRGDEVTPGRFVCLSNLIVHRDGTATADFCATKCPFVDRDNYAATSRMPAKDISAFKHPCIHRGDFLREDYCAPCQGGNRRVHACAIHGECTAHASKLKDSNGKWMAACSVCDDEQQFPSVPDAPKPPPRVKGLIIGANNDSGEGMANSYLGQDIFLVCGGPSIDGMDLSPLNQRGIIAATCNQVGATHVRPRFAFMFDQPRLFHPVMWADPGIAKFTQHMWRNLTVHNWDGHQWVDSGKKCRDFPDVWFYRNRGRANFTDFLTRNRVASGCKLPRKAKTRNVMMPAFRILYWLGFRRVFLLGTDFHMERGKPYAFGGRRSPGQVARINQNYQVAREWFRGLLPHFHEYGFEVINCTPGSAIEELPKMDFADAVASVTSKFPKLDGLHALYPGIVGVWDFDVQRGFRGDFIVFMLNLLTVAEGGGSDVRLVLVDDPSYAPPTDPHVKRDIRLLAKMFPGRVEVLESHQKGKALVDKLKRHGNVTFPADLKQNAYGYKANEPRLWFQEDAPELEVPQQYLDEAEKEFPGEYVAVNLRHCSRHTARNADPTVWREVLASFPDVQFVMVGSTEERKVYDFGLPNQKFAKDAGGDILLDCAVIARAQLSLFNSGGMEFVAHALGVSFLSWCDHTMMKNKGNPNRIDPETDGESPHYLDEDQRHWATHRPTVHQVVQAIREAIPEKSGIR